MITRTTYGCLAVLIVLSSGARISAEETTANLSPPNLDKLAGQPVDIASSAYQYRADRKADECTELAGAHALYWPAAQQAGGCECPGD